jgi:isochorismate hydrolase
MKTRYYTSANIDKKAKKFLEKLKSLKELHNDRKIFPKKAALLVIDMQDFFCSPACHSFVPSIKPVITRIKEMQDLFLQKELTVIQTQHGNKLENSGQMYTWWHEFPDADDPLAKITDELQDSRVEVIKKTQYDAFWKTDLEPKLHAKGITQVIITGVMAHLCCETTARSAFVRGFDVFFAVDATATYNANFHFGTLYNLAHGFALPVLVNEIHQQIAP